MQLGETMNPIETLARLTAGIIIGILWMTGSMMLITWNKLHGKETYWCEIT